MQKNTRINRVFLDTNIIIDIIDTTRKYHHYAKKIIEIIYNNKIEVVISENMLTTIYYIVTDKINVLKFLDYIVKNWYVYSYSRELIKKAIKISIKNQVDFEDVLQCLCVLENKCEILITNDKKFYNCGIKIMKSEEFIKVF
ncbi:PIN domain-containing protein [Hippea jasoniae]|uniref:PIN domain-containing protein n=1 Tax=Hippea jasoniae TaxID=944479 RepID=UPI0005551A58|nr:PIN domain-containing protein [Hippea jasoniae]